MPGCVTPCNLDQDCPAPSVCGYVRVGAELVEGVCQPSPLPMRSSTCAASEAVVGDGYYTQHRAPFFQCSALASCSTAADCPAMYPICAVVGSTSGMCARAP
jgi:hypothetical protein